MSETNLVSGILPTVAALTHAYGYWKYNSQTKAGTSAPNAVSWAIWAILAIVNAFSFTAITSKVKALQSFVGVAGCSSTFVHGLVARKFEWPKWKEWVVLAICLTAIVVWKFYSPLHANVMVAVAVVISFWPTWEGIWKNPEKEKSAKPWYLWGVAWGLTMINTWIFEGWGLKLAMPIAMTMSHLLTPAIYFYRNKRKYLV